MSAYLEGVTPRRCVRWSLRVLYVSVPLAVAVLLAWGFRMFDVMHARPQLTLMVYLLLLAVALCAGIVAALAACHIAIARAFSAGVRVGQSVPARQRSEPPLRIVE